MVAFLQNIGLPETLLIVVVAILIFGKRLPEVAARAAVQVQRAKRAMSDLRRETGIDAELREARRAVEEAARVSPTRRLELPRPEDEPPGAVERAPRRETGPAETETSGEATEGAAGSAAASGPPERREGEAAEDDGSRRDD